jgi:uncharacterized protein
MTSARTQRVRDPIHGLIVFEADNPRDQLAWALINTPEFQRLRRIKQLGVSEFVFPSATHTRFAHSIGVFHLARKLVEVIRREKKREIGKSARKFDEKRADVAIIAALLHDIGHGPYSHMFEGAIKQSGFNKNHEVWTREIIASDDGKIGKLLDGLRPGFRDEVANLFKSDVPEDIYAAVVSSSFDADRLDYMRRDRFMTGSGAGAIDYDWLVEHVRIGKISVAVDDSPDKIEVDTFCFDPKALPAAEQFLLSRYTLYEQVYFHKVTRCVEKMLGEMLTQTAKLIKEAPKTAAKMTGLTSDHPLVNYLSEGGQTLSNYLELDDSCIAGSLTSFQRAADKRISGLARRILERRLFKTLDMHTEAGNSDKDDFVEACRQVEVQFKNGIANGEIIVDMGAKVKMYTEIEGISQNVHKKIYILDAGKPKQISKVSKLVGSLSEQRSFTRYYFETESVRDQAKAVAIGTTRGAH